MHRKANAPKRHQDVEICGTNVKFPFVPYDAQLLYMEKIMQSLQSKKNAILESPTGTGKTLCLLCATLAWRESILKTATTKEEVPRIIYSSRTHSQLQQVVKELKSTSYKPCIAVLGSREYLCVEEKVSKLQGTKQNLACRSLVKNQRCQYKMKFDKFSRNYDKDSMPILDIEELVSTQKEKMICPFYLSRHMSSTADILFVPYNYLIDPIARSSVGVSLENAILIFDEAHNVESVASDASSYSFSAQDITGCVEELDQFIHALQKRHIEISAQKPVTIERLQKFREFLIEVGKALCNIPLSEAGGCTKPGNYIFEFFKAFGLDFQTCPLALSLIESIIETSQQKGEDAAVNASPKLEMFMNFLYTVFREEKDHLKISGYYRVHVQEVKISNQQKLPHVFFADKSARGSTSRVFNYWCFHPGVTFSAIASENIYNIILTSGTLSPLTTTIRELGIDFPIQLENNHVIDASQVWIRVLRSGVTGKRLNSSYKTRTSPDYLTELGNTIVNLVRLTPNGMLVFFPSYIILEEALSFWQKSSTAIWNRIAKLKEVFVEPRNRLEFKVVVDDYHHAVTVNPKGAVFFAVCRGKVSEGIDFSDKKGRMVVITGLPFPPTRDPKILLKKSFLDENITLPGETKLTGNQWYIQQATRAVNQAIGRVIRHRHDFGAIVLCDERFCLQQQQNGISKWLQPFCNPCKNYGDAHMSLTKFFKQNDPNLGSSDIPVTRKRTIDPQNMDDLNLKTGVELLGEVNDAETTTSAMTMTSMSGVDTSDISQDLGDGQSYVDPQLFRKVLEEKSKTDGAHRSIVSGRPGSAPSAAKGMLHSIMSTSRPVTNSTSSVYSAFKPPRIHCEEVAGKTRGTKFTDHDKREIDAAFADQLYRFPIAMRQLLSKSRTEKLFELMKQLPTMTSKEPIFQAIWSLIQGPGQKKVFETLTAVLSENIRVSFIKYVETMEKTGSGDLQKINSKAGSPSNISEPVQMQVGTFFSRLGHKRNKKLPPTVITTPQCLVCLDGLDNNLRKPYASTCGHICCKKCWNKMVYDGYVSCPICKLPTKFDQLRLLHAAEDRIMEVSEATKNGAVDIVESDIVDMTE